MQNMRLQVAIAAVVAGLRLASSASAAAISFVGADGSDLTNTTNWSPVPATAVLSTGSGNNHDLTFGDGAGGATSTWTGTQTYWHANSVTFSRTGGFTMANNPNGTVYLNGATPVTTSAAGTYQMPGFNFSTSLGVQIPLYGGSTLNIASAMMNNSAALKLRRTDNTNAAYLNFTLPGWNGSAWAAGLDIGTGVDSTVKITTGYTNSRYTLNNLTGAGNLSWVAGSGTAQGSMILTAAGFSNFTGTLASDNQTGGNGIYLNTNTGGTTQATFTGGRFLADHSQFRGVVPVRFQGSELANTGATTTSRFYFIDGTTTARALTAAGSSFKPGGDNASSIMNVVGDLTFDENSDEKSKLYIDITGAGAIAGTDFDQLGVLKSTNGGTVASTTSASDKLADVELWVNINPSLTQADLAGDILTILRSDKTGGLSFVGSQFASVPFSGTTAGTLNYNSDGTITLSSVVVPEPAVISLLAASSMLLGLRRRKA